MASLLKTAWMMSRSASCALTSVFTHTSLIRLPLSQQVKTLSILSNGGSKPAIPSAQQVAPSTFLSAKPVIYNQAQSYKVRSALRKRCSACYFVSKYGRMYVECTKHPRHKQMQMVGWQKLWREDSEHMNWRGKKFRKHLHLY